MSISKGIVSRDEVFIVSKIWPTHFKSEELMFRSLNETLRDLQTGYVDQVNLQSYLSTTSRRKLTVVFEYYEQKETYSRI
jgi:diketogulonate reductase-like aldo/keto reductase